MLVCVAGGCMICYAFNSEMQSAKWYTHGSDIFLF